MEEWGGCPYRNLGPASEDPPDCHANDAVGNLVAIEVTELVNQEAIRLSQSDDNGFYRDWNEAKLIEKIGQIIRVKDFKQFMRGPYHKKILVIHTDEFKLTSEPYAEQYASTLKTHGFRSEQFNEIYVLFSYNPRTRSYPFVKLTISKPA